MPTAWIETPDGPAPPTVEGFSIAHRAPPHALLPYVHDIVGYREDTLGHFRQLKLAPVTVPLIIPITDGFAVGLGTAPGESQGRPFTAGLYPGPVQVDSRGRTACVHVALTPAGARRLFGVPMRELSRRVVTLEDLLGAAAVHLRENVSNEPRWDRRFAIVEAFLGERLLGELPASGAHWAFRELVRSAGTVRIGGLSAALGWSRKHLVERFHDEIGLAPKTVARMLRFHRLLELARQDRQGWAGLAVACGYADQAHLVREFRAFAGETPTVWRQRLAGGDSARGR